MGLREWLVVVGILVLVGILMDGYRRMRKAKQFSLPAQEEPYEDPEELEREAQIRRELPNGGSRKIGEFPAKPRTRQAPVAAPQAGPPATEDPVPVLNDALAPGGKPDPDTLAERAARIRDEFSYDRGFAAAAQAQAAEPLNEPAAETPQPVAAATAAPASPVTSASPQTVAEQMPVEMQPVSEAAAASTAAPVEPAPEPEPAPKAQPQDDPLAQARARRVRETFGQAQEIIAINVMAREPEGFSGPELLHIILACGLRYGEMNIFHRYEDGPDGALQFSMANAVKPGEFDLDTMDQFSTPGVTFIMALPGPSNNMQAFNYMLETANCLAKNLHGELQDEQRSVMTQQTIEHCRHRIREFERRLLSKAHGG